MLFPGKVSHLCIELKDLVCLSKTEPTCNVQNYFLVRYNFGIAGKEVSVLEILLTLIKRVQPHGVFLKKMLHIYL